MNKLILLGLLSLAGCGNGVVVIVGSDGTACMQKINGEYTNVPCENLTKEQIDKARWIDAMGVKVKEN